MGVDRLGRAVRDRSRELAWVVVSGLVVPITNVAAAPSASFENDSRSRRPDEARRLTP
jgi:hypothetical protein